MFEVSSKNLYQIIIHCIFSYSPITYSEVSLSEWTHLPEWLAVNYWRTVELICLATSRGFKCTIDYQCFSCCHSTAFILHRRICRGQCWNLHRDPQHYLHPYQTQQVPLASSPRELFLLAVRYSFRYFGWRIHGEGWKEVKRCRGGTFRGYLDFDRHSCRIFDARRGRGLWRVHWLLDGKLLVHYFGLWAF